MKSPFDTPGPKPGPSGVVSQHKAMASGYEIPMSKRRVNINQKQSSTGCTSAPGLCYSKKRK